MMRTANTEAITFYNLLVSEITQAFNVVETASPNPGNEGLKLLEAVSNLDGVGGIVPEGGSAEDKDEDRRHRSHRVLQPAGGWDRASV